jgi:hypothetical protein
VINMFVHTVKFKYWEPKLATIELETPNRLTTLEAENMATEEFKERYPEALDFAVEDVIDLN